MRSPDGEAELAFETFGSGEVTGSGTTSFLGGVGSDDSLGAGALAPDAVGV